MLQVRIGKGDLTNATALQATFAKHSFDVVYHLSDPPGVAAALAPPSQPYTHDLVRSALRTC